MKKSVQRRCALGEYPVAETANCPFGRTELCSARSVHPAGSIEHVIRTRSFVTDVSKWQEVAEVHGKVFANIRPATSIVEVAKLIDADAQIEIEADAILP